MRTIHAAPLPLSLLLPTAATADQPPPETYDVCDEVPDHTEGRPVPAALLLQPAVPPGVMRRSDPTERKEEVADAQR